MNFQTFLFYLFSTVLVFAALRVVTAKNPVHSALFLVLSFFNAACLWMLLKAEFLAITLILVYVGAVMVLFLFVVMMLDINIDKLRPKFWQHSLLGGMVGIAIAVEMSLLILKGFVVVEPVGNPIKEQNNTQALGELLYTRYVFAVEIAAVILLVAIVAAIALTLRRRKDSKFNQVSEQVAVKKKDRIRIVSMPAEKRSDVDDATDNSEQIGLTKPAV